MQPLIFFKKVYIISDAEGWIRRNETEFGISS